MLPTFPTLTSGELTLFRQAARTMQTPRIRGMAEFAESEIIIPDGPREGRPFKLDAHPVSRLLFNELDSGRWRRAFITACNQDGKSLMGFVIPCMWLLFERRETVIMGVPSKTIVADKWRKDLLPTIRASRYVDLLPTRGGGSKEGDSDLIEFKNGARLRFMTAGGNDQARAGFTSRNLVVTETDGFDKVGGNSREGDKFSQLERRLLAFGDQARLIAECTVSTETGRTWNEYWRGTRSRIALPCPHCQAYVTPEREHLTGWQNAETEVAAIANTRIACPKCGATWSDDQRLEANRRGVLVHRGQEIDSNGVVSGPLPETNTLGLRWTCVNAAIKPGRVGLVGGEEWLAKRSPDEEVANRELNQKQWALPSQPAKLDVTQLDAMVLMRRTVNKPRGVCPEGTQCITVGVDCQKRLLYYSAIAWGPHAKPHVVDYDKTEVPADLMAQEEALLSALRTLRDELGDGWKCGDRVLRPTFVFIDAGEWQDTVIAFCEEAGPPFFPTKGYGIGQRREGTYKRSTGSTVVWSKEGYSLIRMPDETRHYIEIKVDQWKTWLHCRLTAAVDQAGGLTLFESNDHLAFCKHLTAEKQVEEFDPQIGTVVKWIALSRNNHWLDATMLACVAGHEAGVRLLLPPPVPAAPPAAARPGETQRPDWMGDRPEKWIDP